MFYRTAMVLQWNLCNGESDCPCTRLNIPMIPDQDQFPPSALQPLTPSDVPGCPHPIQPILHSHMLSARAFKVAQLLSAFLAIDISNLNRISL